MEGSAPVDWYQVKSWTQTKTKVRLLFTRMCCVLLYSYITNHDYHTRESSLIAFDDIIEWRAFGNVSCPSVSIRHVSGV